MIRVVVGTEPAQYIPQKVLEYSIRKSTRSPVHVQFETWPGQRVGGTNFGFVRFLVPKLCGFAGRAIYLDADQIVLGDIRSLHETLDDEHDVAMVQDAEGWFGKKVVGKHNQTSVMVMDCSRLKDWDPATLFDNVVPNRSELEDGQIHYRDFMMASWMDRPRIQALDPSWNHFNVVRPETQLVHFSHVRAQPWKNPDHELTEFWTRWLRRCLVDGALRRREVVRAVMRKQIDRSFLRTVAFSRRVARWLDREVPE